MTRFPQLVAMSRMLDRYVAHRRGELRRLDLLAHGIDLDLDQDQLVDLGQAPDHDDILAKLRIPDKLLDPIWTERHWTRPVNRDGLPAAIASRGPIEGQAIIARARAEADRVRALLVELAKAKITGQVEELVASLPEYRPGDLAWHEAIDGLVDQLRDLPPDPVQDQPQTPRSDPDTAPEPDTTVTPEISGSGESTTTGAGPGSFIVTRDREIQCPEYEE